MGSQINQKIFELNTLGESGSSNEFIIGSTADGKSAMKLGNVIFINDGSNVLKIDGAISTDTEPTGSNDLITKGYADAHYGGGSSIDLNIENGSGDYSLIQKSASGEENTATYEGAISLGKNNQALNKRAFVGGSTNVGAGHTSFTYGQLITNRGGVTTAFGKKHVIAPDPSISENNVIPQENFVIGRHNVVYASSNNGVGNFVVGLNNITKGSYGTVFGSDNYIPANKYIPLSNEDYVGAFIAGAFADADKNNLLFAIGNGDYDTDSQTEQRQNALEVYYNGQVKVKSAPVDNDDALRFGDINLTNGSGSYSIKQKTGTNYSNTVTSDYSIALGRTNTITGSAFSLALGSDNIINITDSGNYNAIIGADNEIAGEAGRVTLIGEGLKNTSWWQTVVGRYNRVDTYSSANDRPLLLVGNGTSDNNRSNAFEVTRLGVARAYGTPTSSNDLVTKGYADAHYGGVQLYQHTITTDSTTFTVRSDVSTSFSDFNDIFTYAVGPVRNEYGQTYIALDNESYVCFEYDAETGDVNLVSDVMPTIISDVVE